MKKKPHFTKLTITLTYYGVGKTPQEAKRNAINEFADNQTELYNSGDYKQSIEQVEREHTPINNFYIKFVMSDDYEEHNLLDLSKEDK